ncbi:hypothetical protein E2C01_072779 [Portunus trituberculatus]|uniref:Uncharacterized protein n=1 Tax=Portunus trituberculatus TaxID=210409 RepID=A0A5B7ICB9_PORTR|nr:hypothetical protein [Portunus trituberculatus]
MSGAQFENAVGPNRI